MAIPMRLLALPLLVLTLILGATGIASATPVTETRALISGTASGGNLRELPKQSMCHKSKVNLQRLTKAPRVTRKALRRAKATVRTACARGGGVRLPVSTVKVPTSAAPNVTEPAIASTETVAVTMTKPEPSAQDRSQPPATLTPVSVPLPLAGGDPPPPGEEPATYGPDSPFWGQRATVS